MLNSFTRSTRRRPVEAPRVGLRDALSSEATLLGAGVVWRTGNGRQVALALRERRRGSTRPLGRGVRDPKVDDHRSAVRMDDDVVRLEVPVDDLPTVRLDEPLGDPLQSIQRLGDRARTLGSDVILQRGTTHERHIHPGDSVVLAGSVHLRDVVAVELGKRSRLLEESAHPVLGSCEERVCHLEGDDALEIGVPRLVNDPHSTLADRVLDLVLANGIGDRRYHHARERIVVQFVGSNHVPDDIDVLGTELRRELVETGGPSGRCR